jgi:hypothetical protein
MQRLAHILLHRSTFSRQQDESTHPYPGETERLQSRHEPATAFQNIAEGSGCAKSDFVRTANEERTIVEQGNEKHRWIYRDRIFFKISIGLSNGMAKSSRRVGIIIDKTIGRRDRA